jgi:hypothetical protein
MAHTPLEKKPVEQSRRRERSHTRKCHQRKKETKTEEE